MSAKQLPVPASRPQRTQKYSRLLGVDYREDSTEVDATRSPSMVNMISDMGGDPIKRSGYRRVGYAYRGMVMANGYVWGVRQTNSNTIYIARLDLSGTDIVEESDYSINIVGHSFSHVYSVYGYRYFVIVLTSIGVISLNVETMEYEISGIDNGMMSVGNIGETAPLTPSIIPETTIALKPDGTDGNSYDDKNLFSIYQRASYMGDGTSTEYIVPAYKKIGSWVKCEIMDDNGDWAETTSYTVQGRETVQGKSMDGNSTVSNRIIDAKVIFNTAPSKPIVAGQPNVRITFAPYSQEQIDGVNRGYFNQTLVDILRQDISCMYSSRLFFAVNEKAYYSDVNRPLVVGDNKWFGVDNVITSFARSSNYLAVITKDNGRNTIFLASEITENATGETAFSVKPSNAGVGSIARKCTGVLNDEPIFLSSTGLFGIATNFYSEKFAVNRSGRINRKLCKEPNLENAVGIPYNGYYYLAINSKMYILDSRHKASQKSGETSYECYFFDHIPLVSDMYVVGNRMYFTDNINTYSWNDDLPEKYRYMDNAIYNGEHWTGTPVKCVWTSKADDDGLPQYYKTLQKKGTMITIKPYTHTGCNITLCKNGDTYFKLGDFDSSITSFNEIDFSKLSFITNATAKDFHTLKKVKKYKRLQIILKNEKAEPFGITSITKTYQIGNYTKR